MVEINQQHLILIKKLKNARMKFVREINERGEKKKTCREERVSYQLNDM